MLALLNYPAGALASRQGISLDGSYEGQNSISNYQSRIIPGINGRLISISIACTFIFSVSGEIAADVTADWNDFQL